MKTEPIVLILDDRHPLIRARVEVLKLREGPVEVLLRGGPEADRCRARLSKRARWALELVTADEEPATIAARLGLSREGAEALRDRVAARLGIVEIARQVRAASSLGLVATAAGGGR